MKRQKAVGYPRLPERDPVFDPLLELSGRNILNGAWP
jgi:hypothetical protein